MTDLVRDAGAFFTFYVLIFSGFLALSAFFRFLGCLCSSYDVAGRLAAALVTVMVLFSGYMVPVFNMKRYSLLLKFRFYPLLLTVFRSRFRFMFWIYYINPLNYGFSASHDSPRPRILVCRSHFKC